MRFDDLYELVIESEVDLQEEGIAHIFRTITHRKNWLGLVIAATMVFGVDRIFNRFGGVERLVSEYEKYKKNHPEQVARIEQKAAEKAAEIQNEKPQEVKELQNKIETKASDLDVFLSDIIDYTKASFNPKVDAKDIPALDSELKSRLRRFISSRELQNLKIDNKLYFDNDQNPTIGVGHLVTPADIDNGLFTKDEIKVDKNGQIVSGYISNARAREIFNYDIDRIIKKTMALFPLFTTFPEALQMVLVDGCFRGDISGSPKVIHLINVAAKLRFNGNLKVAKNILKKAAAEFLQNKEYRRSVAEKTGVHKRMEYNAKVIADGFNTGKDETKISYDSVY